MTSLEEAIEILKLPNVPLPAFPKKADLLKGFEKQLKKLKKKASKVDCIAVQLIIINFL